MMLHGQGQGQGQGHQGQGPQGHQGPQGQGQGQGQGAGVGVSDCFTVGSSVWLCTCTGQEIEGEVQAFETNTKMLVLKGASSSGRAHLHDVHIVNLALVSDLRIKKDAQPSQAAQTAQGTQATPSSPSPDNPAAPATPQLNLTMLERRCRNAIDEKRRLVSAMTCDDPDGQRLFLTIARTIKDIAWSGQNIKVFNQVMITPPYKVENICGDPDSREFAHIKKVVERHIGERIAQQNNGSVGPAHDSPPVSAPQAAAVATTRPPL